MLYLFTALNLVKLIALISLTFVFLLGQGWLVVGGVLHQSFKSPKGIFSSLHEIPLILLSGLISNYGIGLVFQSLKASLIIGVFVSSLGFYYFSAFIISHYKRTQVKSVSINKWIGIFFLCLTFLAPILTEPLLAWDARSIWFFHAKMIYTAEAINQFSGWQHSSVVFSHVDYPNLIPFFAAETTYLVGFWNEYLPKIALFFLLVPAVIWLFTFARKSFSFVFLILLIPASFHMQMWDGMMDGYLALYFSISMLLLGRYLQTSQKIDLISSLYALIILLYIKNEGVLALISGILIIFLFVVFLKEKKRLPPNFFSENWKYYLAGFVALLPFTLWSYYKYSWSLSNDLEVGSVQSLLQIIGRMKDGSYKTILKSLYREIEGALMLLGFIYLSLLAWRKTIPKESFAALLAAGIYGLGIIIVYLLTPHDLAWHLATSINRTPLPIIGAIFIGIYYMLVEIENIKKEGKTLV